MRQAAGAAVKGRPYYNKASALFIDQYLQLKMLHDLGFTHDPNELNSLELEIIWTIHGEFLTEYEKRAEESRKEIDALNKKSSSKGGGLRRRRR